MDALRNPRNGRKRCKLFPCGIEIPEDQEYCRACQWIREKNAFQAAGDTPEQAA